MSEKYRVVYREDLDDGADKGPLWEPGCPLQIVVAQVSRNVGTAELYLQLRLRNVGDKSINSYAMSVSLVHDDLSEEHLDFEQLDVDISPGSTHDTAPRHLGHGTVSSLSLRLTSITLYNTTWKSSGLPTKPPSEVSLSLPDDLVPVRKRALEEAVGSVYSSGRVLKGKVQQLGNYWVCACGQVNVERETCCSCHFKKSDLLRLESEEVLRNLAQSYRQIDQTKETESSTRKKRVAILIIAMLCVAIAATGALYISGAFSESSPGSESSPEQQMLYDPEEQYEYVLAHQDPNDELTREYLIRLASLSPRGNPEYRKIISDSHRLLDELYPDE